MNIITDTGDVKDVSNGIIHLLKRRNLKEVLK